MTNPLLQADDQTCWTQFRQGNDVALGQLMTRHVAALYHYGCTFCGKPDLVDDTIQDVFFDLWQQRHRLPDVVYVKTYLLTTLRNRLTDTLRRPNRLLLRDEWSDADLFTGEFLLESQVIEEEQAQTRQIQQLLAQLTKRQREALYLRFYQGLDNEAIADLMQVSKPAVANLISTALVRMRQQWGTLFMLLFVLRLSFSARFW